MSNKVPTKTKLPDSVAKLTIRHKNGTIRTADCTTEQFNGQTIMYTIISGTNRPGSYTLKVAKEYQRLLKEKGIRAELLSLEGLNLLKSDTNFEWIEKEIIAPTDKFLFIVPEYNGSYPGVLKLLFDTGKSHAIWWHKKALLTGISTGRAGNVRGMEHLAGVLNYLKVTVYPNMQPLSGVDKLMDASGKFNDANTVAVINQQLDQFIKWYS